MTVIFMIMLNTAVMGSNFYDQPDWLTSMQDTANLFFTVFFLIEMIIKLIALGCEVYSRDGFNLFDAFIVVMSYVDLASPGSSSGTTVLRAFRLLRIFKIIKSWKSLQIVLLTVMESMSSTSNLTFLILLYLFLSALLTK